MSAVFPKPAITVSTSGFTLVEVLVVLTLLVVLSVMLTPLLLPTASRTLGRVANEVTVQMRELRREARSRRKHKRFEVDTLGKRYRTERSKPWQKLPEAMTVELTTAESLLHTTDSGTIDFYRDGSSSGGQIVLGLEGHVARIDVEWLTGYTHLSVTAP